MSDTVIERTRGDTLTPEEITVVNKKTGVALLIAGHTFLLTVDTLADPPDNTTEVFQVTGVITDAVNGIVEFPLTNSDADNVGNFFFDIQMTETSSGKKDTVMNGSFNMEQDITKA